MFIGHFAVGFAAKRWAPRTSLGLLMTAPLLADLLWPPFLLLGLESVVIDPGNTAFTPLDLRDYPYSHSLLFSVLWSLLFAGLYHWKTRDARGSLILGLGVFSHWILDLVTHGPDMPLYPGSSVYWGLGLWNSVPWTILVESLMFAAALRIYSSCSRAQNRTGRWAFYAFALFLVLGYIANITAPPPPSPDFIAWGALSGWLFPLWAWWFDRNRKVV